MLEIHTAIRGFSPAFEDATEVTLEMKNETAPIARPKIKLRPVPLRFFLYEIHTASMIKIKTEKGVAVLD